MNVSYLHSRFGARSIAGACALLSLLVLAKQPAFADTITLVDNADIVSATYVGTDITGAGGTVDLSLCPGNTHACRITVNPLNAFSGGPYISYNILDGSSPTTLGDTLSESPNGLVLTFTSDSDPAILSPIGGASGLNVSNGLANFSNTVTFGIPGGNLGVSIFVQQINDSDAVPEPATAPLMSLGFGLVGTGIYLRGRRRAREAKRQSLTMGGSGRSPVTH